VSHDHTTNRQNQIFVAENWRKIYQTFQNADFQSYDFETLRKTMIDYLKEYYPEDFNDFIESSEFVALIDLIAFLGQSYSFRVDLNARENFLATAERRDSVLRLARLISYQPKRNVNAKGLLKLTSVSTTENVTDSNGINLSESVITWNDINNVDFLEQFTLILNAAMVTTQRFGKPYIKDTINGIRTEQYQINSPGNSLPIFSFSSTVNGQELQFEIVPGTFKDDNKIYEEAPNPNGLFSFLYRNDGKGNASTNTGFFAMFKQGEMQNSNFSIDEPKPNIKLSVSVNNITQDDVWLYSINQDTTALDVEWKKIDAITGQNVIFNSLNKNERNLFSVNPLENDQIELNFGDDIFASIPRGRFRTYYRVGNNLTYVINPNEINNLDISIPYINREGQSHVLTATFELLSHVDNAASRETIANIKEKAPQAFYNSGRMVNGEDYNTYPLANTSSIVKVKAVNRVSSGISRFLDVVDTTARYSSTNIFAEDGILYRDIFTSSFDFEFVNDSDILDVIKRKVEPILNMEETRHFFYDQWPQVDMSTLSTWWAQSSTGNNVSTGYFTDDTGVNPQTISTYTSNNRLFLREGSLVRFIAPTGKYFKDDGTLVTGSPVLLTDSTYIWSTITNVVDEGTNQGLGSFTDGTGPVVLNEIIPSTSIVDKIISPYISDLIPAFETSMLVLIKSHSNFGIRFDRKAQTWIVIENTDLNKTGDFDLSFAGDNTGQSMDASWIVRFESDGETYTVTNRGLRYLFESELETRFYFDKNIKVFDPKTGLTIKDTINILKVNSEPDSASPISTNFTWQIYDTITEADGVKDTRKVKVTFADKDSDGIPDDPDQFTKIVAPSVSPNSKLVYFEKYLDVDNLERFKPFPVSLVNATFASVGDEGALAQYEDGQVIYYTTDKTFRIVDLDNSELDTTVDYKAFIGRNNLLFQYRHNAPNNRRIDPASSNLIDMYILTKAYDTAYRNFATDTTNTVTEPIAPTTEDLAIEFSSFNNVKSISDDIVFNPVVYKKLFGTSADPELKATFKVIKNDSLLISDQEVKSQILIKINEYFEVANWDFGDTFYFSELSAFLHQELSTIISSIIIVPDSGSLTFGALYQISSEPNELFISTLRAENIQIINSVTASNIRSAGVIALENN